MAKTKYRPDFPTLAEGYAREGYTDEQIAERLGVSRDTFYRYQKIHTDFAEAIARGKAPIDFEAENNLIKLIRGYDYKETTRDRKTVKIPLFVKGKDDKREVVYEEKVTTHVREVVKHVPPSLPAISKWLNNRRPDRWRDKHNIDLNTVNPLDHQMQEKMSQMSMEEILKIAFEDDADSTKK